MNVNGLSGKLSMQFICSSTCSEVAVCSGHVTCGFCVLDISCVNLNLWIACSCKGDDQL